MSEKKHISTSRARSILSQVVACLVLDFLLIGLGMSISFVTMVLPEVLDAKEGLSITQKQASWFGSMAFLCQPLGSMVSGPILDYFGRRKALFIVNIPHLIAWLLMYYAWDAPSLFIGNALLGIGTGVMEAPSVTYVGEISDPQIRGVLTTLTNAFTSTGTFIAYLLGATLPWRQAALVALTIPIITMSLVLIIPETPIWLLSKGRQKEALQSLCRLRGWVNPEDVKKEFEELVNYHEITQQCVVCLKKGYYDSMSCEHKNQKNFVNMYRRFKSVFFVRETLRPFGLVLAYFFFHSANGFIPIRANMVNFCKALGMKYDSKLIVVIVGIACILINLLTSIIVKILGKRAIIIGSLLGSAICCLGISFYVSENLPPEVFSYDITSFPDIKEVLPVVLFMVLVCLHGLAIPWVLMSEVFPFRSRGVATGMTAALAYFIFFLASKTNYNLEASVNLNGTFVVYACIGFIGTSFMYLFLPETEGKSLAEIEEYYKSKQFIVPNDFLIKVFKKKQQNNDAEMSMLS